MRLDAAAVASIIEAQFPEMVPATVGHLGEGCDSTAFDVNGQWVFRFPKRADVDQQLGIESRALRVLARHSPVPLPVFSFHGQPSHAFPYHFVGYRKLPGVPAIRLDHRAIPSTRWVPIVASFLSWLHRFPPSDARDLGVHSHDVAAMIDEARTEALDGFERLHEIIEEAPFDEWRRFFVAGEQLAAPGNSDVVLVHGDLSSEHVLYDPSRHEVTGIIDWSDMALSDRSLDLALFFHWGGQPCVDAALFAYEGTVDDRVLARARFLAACRGVGDVQFGLETRRQEYLEAGTRALVLCLGDGNLS